MKACIREANTQPADTIKLPGCFCRVSTVMWCTLLQQALAFKRSPAGVAKGSMLA